MGRTKGSKNKATLKWEAYWLNKEKAKGILQAKAEEDRKHPERVILEWLKSLIKPIDITDLIAYLSTTYIIHGIILTSAELYERAKNIGKGLTLISGKPDILNNLPFADTPLGWVSDLPWLINTYIQAQNLSEERKKQIIEGLTKIVERPDPDSLYIWALSFAIAYYIQKHGITNIFSSIKAFLGFAPEV